MSFFKFHRRALELLIDIALLASRALSISKTSPFNLEDESLVLVRRALSTVPTTRSLDQHIVLKLTQISCTILCIPNCLKMFKIFWSHFKNFWTFSSGLLFHRIQKVRTSVFARLNVSWWPCQLLQSSYCYWRVEVKREP